MAGISKVLAPTDSAKRGRLGDRAVDQCMIVFGIVDIDADAEDDTIKVAGLRLNRVYGGCQVAADLLADQKEIIVPLDVGDEVGFLRSCVL